MKKVKKVECPKCDGLGELAVETRQSHRIDPLLRSCPYCSGSGLVSEAEAEEYDEDECYDVSDDERWADHRFEMENDR